MTPPYRVEKEYQDRGLVAYIIYDKDHTLVWKGYSRVDIYNLCDLLNRERERWEYSLRPILTSDIGTL